MVLKKFYKDKKAVSIMIGYVLLITAALVMAGIVYVWVETLVPSEVAECPDGVSMFVDNLECVFNEDTKKGELNLSIVNNGRFDLAGYYIYATNDTNQTIATFDLSKNASNGVQYESALLLLQNNLNNMEINGRYFNSFNLSFKIYSIEIIPARFQKDEEKNRIGFKTCGDSKIREEINCHFCGDGVKESGEDCDGNELGGLTCSSFGYDGGTLGCYNNCAYDKSGCTNDIEYYLEKILYEGWESGVGDWVYSTGNSRLDTGINRCDNDGNTGGANSWFLKSYGANSYVNRTFDFSEYEYVNLNFSVTYNKNYGTLDDCLILRCNSNILWTYCPFSQGNIDGWFSDCTDSHCLKINKEDCDFDNPVEIKFESNYTSNGESYIDCINITGTGIVIE